MACHLGTSKQIRRRVRILSALFRDIELAEPLDARSLNVGHAPEFAQEFLGGTRTDAGNFAQGRLGLALAATEPVEGNGEAVGLVANLLDEVEDWGVAVEYAGFVFLAENIENFFFFGDGWRAVD